MILVSIVELMDPPSTQMTPNNIVSGKTESTTVHGSVCSADDFFDLPSLLRDSATHLNNFSLCVVVGPFWSSTARTPSIIAHIWNSGWDYHTN
mgnify:CR=1 FL=1